LNAKYHLAKSIAINWKLSQFQAIISKLSHTNYGKINLIYCFFGTNKHCMYVHLFIWETNNISRSFPAECDMENIHKVIFDFPIIQFFAINLVFGATKQLRHKNPSELNSPAHNNNNKVNIRKIPKAVRKLLHFFPCLPFTWVGNVWDPISCWKLSRKNMQTFIRTLILFILAPLPSPRPWNSSSCRLLRQILPFRIYLYYGAFKVWPPAGRKTGSGIKDKSGKIQY